MAIDQRLRSYLEEELRRRQELAGPEQQELLAQNREDLDDQRRLERVGGTLSQAASKMGRLYGKEAGSLLPDYLNRLRQDRQAQMKEDLAAEQRARLSSAEQGRMLQYLGKDPRKEGSTQTRVVSVGGKPMIFEKDPETGQWKNTGMRKYLRPRPARVGRGSTSNDGLIDPGKLKGSEWDAALNWETALKGHQNMTALELSGYDPSDFWESMKRDFTGAAKFFGADTKQASAYEQAATAFIAPILKKQSGAAVTEKDLEQYGGIYFPTYGDSEADIQSKRQAREIFLRKLKAEGSRAIEYERQLKGITNDPEKDKQPEQPEQPEQPGPVGGQGAMYSHQGKPTFGIVRMPKDHAESYGLKILTDNPGHKNWDALYQAAINQGLIK